MGSEQDVLSVRRPADSDVRAGMISQPAGLATRRRHDVHVNIAVVISAESHHRAIRRKDRSAFQVAPGYQAICFTSLAADDPYIASIDESDLGRAESGSLEKQRVFRIGKRREGNCKNGNQQERRLGQHGPDQFDAPCHLPAACVSIFRCARLELKTQPLAMR